MEVKQIFLVNGQNKTFTYDILGFGKHSDVFSP